MQESCSTPLSQSRLKTNASITLLSKGENVLLISGMY